MIGKILNNQGQVFSDDKLMIVHKFLLKNSSIPSHNHKDFYIFFTLIKGKVEVCLNGMENHILQSGDILKFDGDNYISATGVEDSEIYIYLIKK